MRVTIPTPLLSYTGQQREIDVEGASLAEVLRNLDQRFPGIRFRMVNEQDQVRPHMRIFVNGEKCADLDAALQPTDEVDILQALSGG